MIVERKIRRAMLWTAVALLAFGAARTGLVGFLLVSGFVAWRVSRRRSGPARALRVAGVAGARAGGGLAAQGLSALRAREVQRRAQQAPKQGSLWDGIPIGVDASNGKPITLKLVGKSILVGGIPGCGKTSLLRLLVGAAAQDPSCDLLLVDGKKVGLGPWRDRARRFATEPDEVIDLLAEIKAEMLARYDKLLERGSDEIERGDGFRLLVVVVDELSYFTSPGAPRRAETDELLGQLVRLGRAAGVVVICATQRPTVDTISGQVRDNIGWRLALRTRTDDATRAILGDVNLEDAPAHQLPDDPGLGYLLAESGQPRLIRVYANGAR